MIEKQEIKKYLPHREPFLFVDGVTEIIKDEYIKGYKEVKEEEYYFKGHFPDNPILPGVIIIEALAQVSGILGFVTMNKTPEEGSIYYFVGTETRSIMGELETRKCIQRRICIYTCFFANTP